MQPGFFGSLFDLSFSSFVTTRVIKLLYVLSLSVLVLAYLGIALALFSGGGGSDYAGEAYQAEGGNVVFGLLWLLFVGPLMLLFYTLLYRVVFELIIVVFGIFENTRAQLELTRAAQGGPGGWTAPEAPTRRS